MTYREAARKLQTLGCREIPRRGAPQVDQSIDAPLDSVARSWRA
jgi:hypothetical protein